MKTHPTILVPNYGTNWPRRGKRIIIYMSLRTILIVYIHFIKIFNFGIGGNIIIQSSFDYPLG